MTKDKNNWSLQDEIDEHNQRTARLKLENIVLLLNRKQPNVPLALREAQRALIALGGVAR